MFLPPNWFFLLLPDARELQLLPVVGGDYAPSPPPSHFSPSRELRVGCEGCHERGLRPVPGLSHFHHGKAFRQAPLRAGFAGLLAKSLLFGGVGVCGVPNHPAPTLLRLYSPECVEGKFSEVDPSLAGWHPALLGWKGQPAEAPSQAGDGREAVRFGIEVPQDAPFATLVERWQRTEELGFDICGSPTTRPTPAPTIRATTATSMGRGSTAGRSWLLWLRRLHASGSGPW